VNEFLGRERYERQEAWSGYRNGYGRVRRVTVGAETVRKMIYPALQRLVLKWKRPIKDWVAALDHFNLMFEGEVQTT